VRDLTAGYRNRRVLTGMSFAADHGVLALAGPNGTGKTTLLRVLATLHGIDSGSVEICGADLATPRGRGRARANIGFLPQEPDFPGEFTVHELLVYSCWLQRIPRNMTTATLDTAIRAFDLAGIADEQLRRLSTGMRRRCFLAQATIHRPDVLLLDEPTSGIDAEHRAEFRRLLRQLATDRLVILSTQLIEELDVLADRVLVLSDGSAGFDGTPSQLIELAAGVEPQPEELPMERALRAVALRRKARS